MRDFQLPGRSPVLALNGICATSHPLAAQAAVAILGQGGNAVDAAIAALFVLCVAEPHMVGLGGDCVALVQTGNGAVETVNGIGRAPLGLSDERRGSAEDGRMPAGDANAVTVPGLVDACCRMAERWGRLGIDALLQPAIAHAEEGIPLAPRIALDWGAAVRRLQGGARGLYALDGHTPRAGQVLPLPGLAEALRRIACAGRAGFYEGDVAADMCALLRSGGGVHTQEDFARAETCFGAPMLSRYRGAELLEHPPRGQAATVPLLAGILACHEPGAWTPWDPRRAHLELEAERLAQAGRLRNGEAGRPDLLAARIHPDRAGSEAPAPLASAAAPALAGFEDTVGVTVIDRDLTAVSLVASMAGRFGSGLASPRFGILMNNRGGAFARSAEAADEAPGGRRPPHSLSPAMLCEGGRLSAVFSVVGSGWQSMGHVRLLSDRVDFGLDLQASIDGPRCQMRGAEAVLERGYAAAVHRELAAMGHRVRVADRPLGGAQGIRIDHDRGVLEGASDGRKDGCALGL